jgi:polysaccharide pyruvyl transferase WcaK-like protein
MKQNFPKIWVLGASFETSNMGINALAESSLKCIFTHWPDASVILQTNEDGVPLKFTFSNKKFSVDTKKLWFGRNIFKPQNAYVLLMYALLLKVIPASRLKKALMARNPYFKDIMETDIVVDITAGDSFSDLYDMRRLIFGSLFKWLFILCGKKLVMLPQTYGPFNKFISKAIARSVLARTTAIYSRDQKGVEYVRKLLGKAADKTTIQFIPDVAFVLDAEKPDSTVIEKLESAKVGGHVIVGLNISGLLYNDAQAERKFGLKSDYQQLVSEIIKLFMAHQNTVVVLVPHVFAQTGRIESDPDACRQVYQLLADEYPDRIILVEETLDHKQVKYLISCCDFFLGSRMHSCIAAISQSVPAIGLAYSGKFIGVFDSVGVGDLVVDLRIEDESQILVSVQEIFEKRQQMAEKLRVTIPKVQEKVLGLFDDNNFNAMVIRKD